MDEEKQNRYKKTGKRILTIYVIAVIVISFIQFGFYSTRGLQIRTKYNSIVHISDELSDPYIIKSQMIQSLKGIKSLELTGSDFTTPYPWDKIKYRTVDRVILRTQSIIERCNDIIDWIDTIESSSISMEVSGDIYHEKIDHLTEEVSNLYKISDTIRNAYIIKHTPIFIVPIIVLDNILDISMILIVFGALLGLLWQTT